MFFSCSKNRPITLKSENCLDVIVKVPGDMTPAVSSTHLQHSSSALHTGTAACFLCSPPWFSSPTLSLPTADSLSQEYSFTLMAAFLVTFKLKYDQRSPSWATKYKTASTPSLSYHSDSVLCIIFSRTYILCFHCLSLYLLETSRTWAETLYMRLTIVTTVLWTVLGTRKCCECLWCPHSVHSGRYWMWTLPRQ